MSRSDEERLDDVRAAIGRCLAYREHLASAEFGSMAYDAVLRNLAVIGEAAKALPDEFKSAHSEVAWPSLVGLRSVVVHEHFRVNPDLVRDILDEQLVLLLAVLDDVRGR